MPDAAVDVEIPVRFAETDAMGVVHHAAYIVWFEAGRVAWMQAAGMPYAEIAAAGYHLAVTAVHAEYRNPSRFGDVVVVRTRLTRLQSRKVCFAYDLYRQDLKTLFVQGISEHICVDLNGRMSKIPANVLERLQAGKLHLEEWAEA